MSADISKLREIVGSHLAKWRATTPLEDFANVDDVYRTLMPELEEFFAAHTNAEIAKVLERLESELNEQKKAAETNLAYHTDVTKNERLIRDWQGTVHGIEFCRPAIQAERAKLKEVR